MAEAQISVAEAPLAALKFQSLNGGNRHWKDLGNIRNFC
jgi:hypothetical protein